MKKGFLIMISMMITAAAIAQSNKAQEIIEKITSKTQAFKSVLFEFTFTYADPVSGGDASEKGKLVICGDKYILDIEGQKVICDGETMWTFIEDAWEVQVNSIGNDDESITPSKLLTSYNKDYKAKLVKEYQEDGVNYQRIELKPDEGKKWIKLDVVVNADLEQISEITIHDKNGGKFVYRIDRQTPNIDVTDDDFTFNPRDYPDVEVIDMR